MKLDDLFANGKRFVWSQNNFEFRNFFGLSSLRPCLWLRPFFWYTARAVIAFFYQFLQIEIHEFQCWLPAGSICCQSKSAGICWLQARSGSKFALLQCKSNMYELKSYQLKVCNLTDTGVLTFPDLWGEIQLFGYCKWCFTPQLRLCLQGSVLGIL